MEGTVSRSLKSLVGVIGLVSAFLFTAVAAGQYLFLTYQLHQRTRADLQWLAEGMRDDIAFEEVWNLQGYRRSSEGADTYVVVTATGTMVDTVIMSREC